MAIRVDWGILSSPEKVFNCAKHYLQSVEAKVELFDGESCRLFLKVSTSYEIQLSNMVDGDLFAQEVEKLAARIRLNTSHPMSRFDLDLCTLQPLLNDWAGFRRAMYEKDGKKCSELILDYIRNNSPKSLETLSFLGLDPNRINNINPEKEVSYFDQVFAAIMKSSQPVRSELFTLYSQCYPKMAELQLSQLADHKHKSNISSAHNKRAILLSALETRVIGQKLAVEKMADLLNFQSQKMTNRCFLFVGPTGVGKTELAKAVAQQKSNRFVLFPMNQFASEMDISRLFGSSAGYVGSTDLPQFAKELDQFGSKPRQEESKKVIDVKNVVILFDEFEKGHKKIQQSLLTLFDEGFCEISYTLNHQNITVRYVLSDCITICTSNLCQEVLLNSFLKKESVDKVIDSFLLANTSLPDLNRFSPELLSRVSIIPFGPIPKGESFQKIIKTKIHHLASDLQKHLPCKEVMFDPKCENKVLLALEDRLYGNGTNIRKIKAYVEDLEGLIRRQEPTWGIFRDKKITITYKEGLGPCLELSIHIPELDRYHHLHRLDPLPI